LRQPGYVILTSGTYKLSGPIALKSNVVLKGAGDSTIIFADGSICNSAEAPAYIFGSGVSNSSFKDRKKTITIDCIVDILTENWSAR
jgi:polygalacturonase